MSILNILISKVFERLVYNQLEEFLLKHKILFKYQSGFRTAYSTNMCLINPFYYIKMESEKGNYTGMVMLDL